MGRFRVPTSRNHCIRIPLEGYPKDEPKYPSSAVCRPSRQEWLSSLYEWVLHAKTGLACCIRGVLFTAAGVFVFESFPEHRPDMGATQRKDPPEQTELLRWPDQPGAAATVGPPRSSKRTA